jgi:hypothetical protein
MNLTINSIMSSEQALVVKVLQNQSIKPRRLFIEVDYQIFLKAYYFNA